MSPTLRPFCLFIIFCAIKVTANAQDRSGYYGMAATQLANSEGFIENIGQIKDQFGNSRPDIGFKLSTEQVNFFIGNDSRLHYQFNRKAEQTVKQLSPGQKTIINSYRMDVSLLGANRHPVLVKSNKGAAVRNYYTARSEQRSIAANYDKVVYKDVYPGIDWEITFTGQKLKYNFIVHPEGNAADIRLKFEGATALSLTGAGGFTATTPLGTITEARPYSYELKSKQDIPSAFELQDDVLSFRTAPCHGTLVIDPEIAWSTYYGGTDMEEVNRLRTDVNGNVFITGITQSVADIATTGSFRQVFAGSYDAFLAAFSVTGQIKWATYFGGAGDDYAFSMAIDKTGSLLVTGVTTSDGYIATPGSHQPLYAGDSAFGLGDAFLAKFNENGQLSWATYFGGTLGDCSNAVLTDENNNIYIGGYTNSSSGIATAGSYKDALPALAIGPPPPDAFLARFNPNGQLSWSTYYGGDGNDIIAGLTISNSGEILVTGETSTTDLATFGAYQDIYGGGTADVFITRFSSGGIPLWCTYLGGADYEHATDIATDKYGNYYIVGGVYGGDMLATPGACQITFGGGGADGFLTKFNIYNLPVWSTYIGGNGFDQVNGIAVDETGNIVVTGITSSANNMLQAPGSGKHYFYTSGTLPNGFLSKYNTIGQRLWGTYYEGVGKSVGCFNKDHIYFAGYSAANNLATSGAYQTYNKGAGDGFLTLIKEDTTVFIVQPYTDTGFCAGAAFRLNYQVSNRFRNGNIFKAQLSDALGNFSSGAIIGTTVSANEGSILCRIPANNPPGNHYRIRIIATAPADTSADDGYNIHIYPGIPVMPSVTVSSNPSNPVAGLPATFTANVINGGNNITYQWLKNGVLIPGATTNPITTSIADGESISVIAYCHLPCLNPDSVISNKITTAVVGVSTGANPFRLYPNPNNGSFTLEGVVNATSLHLQVLNAVGQPVQESTIPVTNNILKQAVHTNSLVPGIYFLRTVADNGELTLQKFPISE